MQPSSPLPIGTTYLDEDLGIEVITVESLGCTYPNRETQPDINQRIPCVYRQNCTTAKSCIRKHQPSDVVYLNKLQYTTFKLTQLVI